MGFSKTTLPRSFTDACFKDLVYLPMFCVELLRACKIRLASRSCMKEIGISIG